MKKALKKKITGLIVLCSMIFVVVAFPMAVSAYHLTFNAGSGADIAGQGETYECDTEQGEGNVNRIREDDLKKVFDAKKDRHLLARWTIDGGSSTEIFTIMDEEKLRNWNFTGDTRLIAGWEPCVKITYYNVDPTDERVHWYQDWVPGASMSEENFREFVSHKDGYKLIGIEYAGKGGNDGYRYEYGTPIDEDTDFRVIWEKVAVPTPADPSGGGGPSSGGGGPSGGGGGPSGGGGGFPNPKTGDLGIAPYVGFMVVSVLGTAVVVKLLKKEK